MLLGSRQRLASRSRSQLQARQLQALLSRQPRPASRSRTRLQARRLQAKVLLLALYSRQRRLAQCSKRQLHVQLALWSRRQLWAITQSLVVRAQPSFRTCWLDTSLHRSNEGLSGCSGAEAGTAFHTRFSEHCVGAPFLYPFLSDLKL